MALSNKFTGAVLVLAFALGSCSALESKFAVECDNAIKEQLKAPSGYKRIEFVESQMRLTSFEAVEALKKQIPKPVSDAAKGEIIARFQKINRLLSGENKSIIRFRREVSYDAPNSFGTLIRGAATCDYYSQQDNAQPFALSMRLNGINTVDRLAIANDLNGN